MNHGNQSQGGDASNRPVWSRGEAPVVAARALYDCLHVHDLTFLPMSKTDSGSHVYHEECIEFVKELRASGVDAGYAHAADGRSYHGERSIELAVAFIVNLASAAVWESFLLALEAYRSRRSLRVTLVEERDPDGTAHRSATFEGSGDEVISALAIYLDKRRE